jgi:hypothetical protein
MYATTAQRSSTVSSAAYEAIMPKPLVATS